ncbi:MAG: glycosyltransferase [Lachnospiraceae bacterium]|jgi:glycosyltransferase involved in cell wall biosynthesis
MSERVCVLLCTYNGEKYLRRQLDSLNRQRGVEVDIFAHDDGSSDKTAEILKEYGIETVGAEHLGAAKGFMYLLENAPEADYYAFCDQDDEWDEDKLSCGVQTMKSVAEDSGLALYCCSSRLVDAGGNFIKNHIIDGMRSPATRMFYASISGNTIIFNREMKKTAARHTPKELVMHDSWLVKLCLALGGTLIVDEEPHIDYRMHGSNEWGMELNLKGKLRKFKNVIKSRGEGQELIDICGLYGEEVMPEFRELAKATELTRIGSVAGRGFMKANGIDFRNAGFNLAFAIKTSKGRL